MLFPVGQPCQVALQRFERAGSRRGAEAYASRAGQAPRDRRVHYKVWMRWGRARLQQSCVLAGRLVDTAAAVQATHCSEGAWHGRGHAVYRLDIGATFRTVYSMLAD